MTIYNDIIDLNIEQFKSSENFNKILQIAASMFDEISEVMEDLKNILNIDLNSNSQLDLIGAIVIEPRNARTDEDYKKALKLKIFKNTATTRVNNITNIIQFITDSTKIVYSDNPPASYTIYVNGLNIPSNIKIIIDNVSAAGVSVIVYASIGETPFIATETQTIQSNLINNTGDNLIDDAGGEFIVDYETQFQQDVLQQIYDGTYFGVVENKDLVTDTGLILVTDTGAIIGAYGENQNIINGGKANLVYQ